MESRLSKALMCLALAAFAAIAAFDNIADYDSNYVWVRHVLSMDTTDPGNLLRYRAITNPLLWHGAYAAIIAGEAVTALLYAIAASALWRNRKGGTAQFQHSKKWAVAATSAGFCVWFLGFGVIGGEWFGMWQSQHWNGQDRAFTVYVTLLAVMIFINQSDPGQTEP